MDVLVGHLIEQLLVVGEDLGEGAGGAEAVAELPCSEGTKRIA